MPSSPQTVTIGTLPNASVLTGSETLAAWQTGITVQLPAAIFAKQADLVTLTGVVAAKQPLDATLTSIAALSVPAGSILYSTASDTFAVSPISAFGRSLIDDATAAAARTTLNAAANDDGRLSARGRRNLLLNGDFRVNQRVFAGGTLAAGQYGPDLWRASAVAATLTVSTASVSLTGTIVQFIENPGIAGQTVTVSVTNPSGAIGVKLQIDTTTAGASGTIPAGSGVQSVTLVVPAIGTGNLVLLLTTAVATTFDSYGKGAGVQMEMGSAASSYEIIPPAESLMLCQRWYEKSFPMGTAPAQNAGTAGSVTTAQAVSAAGNQFGWYTTYKVPKASSPTVNLFNPSAANAQARNANVGIDCTGTSTGGESNTNGFNVLFTAAAGTAVGQSILLHFTAKVEL